MTDTTQDIDLQDVAQAWREKVDAAHQKRNEEHVKAERERAIENGQHVFDKILGQDLADAGVKLPPLTWMAEGPDAETASGSWSATATVAGFQFRAQERYQGGDYGYSRELHLLRTCSKDIRHGFEQIPVGSLYDLADILTDPASVTWTCPTCSWEAYEERENRQSETPPPRTPTIGEQLEEVLAEYIGQVVEQRFRAAPIDY